jgi:hypothetical protein
MITAHNSVQSANKIAKNLREHGLYDLPGWSIYADNMSELYVNIKYFPAIVATNPDCNYILTLTLNATARAQKA